ncbi:MAG TPA: hypothetical protein VGL65_13145 [Gemmatimonadales bacterium]|jgi:hypothetical protein
MPRCGEGLARTAVVVAVVLACAGCARQPRPTPLTERQRDSVIGASKLPGASGVRGALRVTDSATARRNRYDSISQAP